MAYYTDPITKQRYSTKEWMFSHIKTLPEVQKAYPDYGKKEPVKPAVKAPTEPYWQTEVKRLEAAGEADKARWVKLRRPSGPGYESLMKLPEPKFEPPKKPEYTVKQPKAVVSDTGQTKIGNGAKAEDIGVKTGDDQARIDAAKKANEIAQTIFDNIKTDDDISTRNSMKILEDVEKKLEKTEEKIPEPQSLVDLFKSKRAELGIEPLEQDRDNLLAEKDRLQAELFAQAEVAGEQLVSTREIGRAKGAIQKRFDRETMLLDVEISAVERMLSNKYNSLEMVMNFTQQDFSNSSKYYTDKYNRTVQLYNLFSKEEEKEYTRAGNAEKDAKVDWDIVTNAMKESGIAYGDLTDDQKLKIQQFETQAGLPAGFSEKILANVNPEKKVLSKITSTDKTQISIIYDDGTVEVFSTGLTTEAEVEPTWTFTNDDGTEVEIKTPEEAVDLLIEQNFSYEDIKDFLIKPAKEGGAGWSVSRVNNYLEGKGLITTKEETKIATEKKEAIDDLGAHIDEYKELWKKKGDENKYGIREEFGREVKKLFPELTYDEIMAEIYEKVSDEWLKENKKPWWKF